jgi:hypothetical protein
MCFKKNQILAQNPNMLAFDFYRKYQFMTKTDQNSIFYGHESHIPCRLHIVVMHINFYGLKKNQISAQIRRC